MATPLLTPISPSMITPSRRVSSMISSPVRKFEPLFLAAEARGVEVIKLQVGNPDLAAPKEFFESMRNYPDVRVPYAPSGGHIEHVAAWISYLRHFGVDIEPHHLFPTMGGTEAIQLMYQLLCDPGDEIIVFEPLYSGFKVLAPMFGVQLRPVTLRFEDHFALPDEEMLEAAVSARTRAILVINPDNPTGKVWSDEELRRIMAFAKRHDLAVVSDETYREIIFTGTPKSMLTYDDSDHRVIVIDSLSKRFSLPGARLGAIISQNTELMADGMKLAMARLSVPTIDALSAIPLLLDAQRITDPVRDIYRSRRDAFASAFAGHESIRVSIPDGAFYVVLKLPVSDAETFTRFMVSEFSHDGATVMVTPLKDFYLTPGLGDDEIRIALVRDEATLRRVADILIRAVEAHQG